MKKSILSTLLVGALAVMPFTAGAATSFSDVTPENPFSTYINHLAEQGIVEGNPDGTFAPHRELTRAEFATMMVRSFKLPTAQGKVVFSDSASHWGASYIQAAFEAGVVKGTSPSTFTPDAKVKREEAATMVWRWLESNGVLAASNTSTAVNTDDWAQKAVQNVLAFDLHGPDVLSNDYHSRDTMNRQQAAALIDLSLQKLEKSKNQPQNPLVNPTSNSNNLIANSDGTKSPGNIQMKSHVQNNYQGDIAALENNLELLAKVKFQISGKNVTVIAPDNGAENIWWTIQDATNQKEWQGHGAKTMQFTNTEAVAVDLFDRNNARILANAAIVYENGTWVAIYP